MLDFYRVCQPSAWPGYCGIWTSKQYSYKLISPLLNWVTVLTASWYGQERYVHNKLRSGLKNICHIYEVQSCFSEIKRVLSCFDKLLCLQLWEDMIHLSENQIFLMFVQLRRYCSTIKWIKKQGENASEQLIILQSDYVYIHLITPLYMPTKDRWSKAIIVADCLYDSICPF